MFNGQYKIEKQIGQGKTAKVYRVGDLNQPSRKYALKLIRYNYLLKNEDNIHAIENEIEVINAL